MKDIYDQMCRLCLQISSELLPIFGDGSNVSDTIMACTIIEISSNDGFPENICHKCIRRLNDAFEFKQQCENSDAVLRQSTKEVLNNEDVNQKYFNDSAPKLSIIGNQLSEVHEQFEVVYELEEQDENNIYSQIEYLVKSENEDSNDSTNNIDIANASDDGIAENADDNDAPLQTKVEDLVETILEQNNDNKLKIPKKEKNMRSSSSREKIEHKCIYCDEILPTQRDLKAHKATHSSPFPCQICQREFSSLSALSLHRKTHKSGNFDKKCEICNKTFTRRYRLVQHMAMHNGEEPIRFECDICYKNFSTNGNLNKHKAIHGNVKPHKCEMCEKAFLQSYQLKYHMDVHRSADCPHECKLCDFTSRRLAALEKHIALNHRPNPPASLLKKPTPAQCTVCNKMLSSEKVLISHMKTHSDAREYLCRHCGKGFVFKNGLESHERIHTGEKPFKCLHCPKTFRHKMGLHVHVRTHTGEKPYHCKLCQKTFSQFSHLRTHIFTHTGERKYECNICSKRFALSEGLRYHKMTHTGAMPFKCSICNRGFYIQYKLKVHMAKSHNMKIEIIKSPDVDQVNVKDETEEN